MRTFRGLTAIRTGATVAALAALILVGVFTVFQAEATVLREVKKLLASDAQAGDGFGWRVAVSGDTAVVGAPGEDAGGTFTGAAYVFQRDQGGAGNWGEVKKLTASDAQAGEFFGWSVAISGDTAVVGVPGEAAYVFQRDQGGADNWGEVSKLTASDAQAGDSFGRSVAISGDTAVVGARFADAEGSAAGAAYVFQRDQGGAGNWGEVTKLTASDAQTGDVFGASVAVSGDTAVVGAFFEDAGGSQAGAAYVFQRDEGGVGNWGEVKKLTASDAQADDSFGFSVAVSGDTAVVGALGEDAGGIAAGAAYLFERNQGGAGNWGEVKKLTASAAQAGDEFGVSVALSGGLAVVGAPGESAGGAAYVFERDEAGADSWGEVKKLLASDAQAGDVFGASVAVSGDTAVVGANGEDAGGDFAGAAYVFERKNADGDTDGDGIPNGTDLDDDNDGCSDMQELGSDPVFGGRRNPHNFWDFFDPNRDKSVSLLDVLAVLARFNSAGDASVDPLSDPPPPPAYHPRFDRGGQAPGGDPWDELPANGSIGLADFLSLLRQFGHTCPPLEGSTAEQAVQRYVELVLGEEFAGDCATTTSPDDIGRYCSVLDVQGGDTKVYRVGLAFSEFSHRITITLLGGVWVVTDVETIPGP